MHMIFPVSEYSELLQFQSPTVQFTAAEFEVPSLLLMF